MPFTGSLRVEQGELLSGSITLRGKPLLHSSALTTVAFIDTTIVWNFAAVTVVLMAVPNLFGIVLVRKEVKALVSAYWQSRQNDWRASCHISFWSLPAGKVLRPRLFLSIAKPSCTTTKGMTQ